MNEIDVSKCPYLIEEHEWWDIAGDKQITKNCCDIYLNDELNRFNYYEKCADNPNCHYKELQQLKAENEFKESQINDWIKQYKLAHQKYMKLQTENEELRKVNNTNVKLMIRLRDYLNDIAEESSNWIQDYTWYDRKDEIMSEIDKFENGELAYFTSIDGTVWHSDKIVQQLKAENELLKNERTIDLRNQLEQLKVENEELKKQIKSCKECAEQLGKHIVAEQCLDEIEKVVKDICDEECDFKWCKGKKHCGDDDCRYMQIMEKIKQAKEGGNNEN